MKISYKTLARSPEFPAALFNDITSAIFLADGDCRLRAVNDPFRALFHKPEDKIIGELCGNVLGCKYLSDDEDCGTTTDCQECSLRKDILRTFHQGVRFTHRKISQTFYIRNKPVLKYFQYSTRPITLEGQRLVMFILEDITQEQVQQIKIQEQNKQLEMEKISRNALLPATINKMATSVSKIYKLAESLNKSAPFPDKSGASTLEEVIALSQFTSELLQMLQAYAELDSSHGVKRDRQVDIIEVVNNSLSISRSTTPNSDISLHSKLPGYPVLMDIDISGIRLIISILIENAKLRIKDKGVIEIGAALKDDHIKIWVEDNGPPVSSQQRQDMFNHSDQEVAREGNDAMKKPGPLVLAEHLAKKNGGKMGVDNNACFWLSLPLSEKYTSL